MKNPKYAKDAAYQELAKICELTGLKVSYKRLYYGIAGRTDNYNHIEMPDECIDGFESSEAATKVLGHELGHCLFERPSTTYLEAFENLITAAKQYEDVSAPNQQRYKYFL